MASIVARHDVLPSSFLPLSVEYREKSFAAGFIPSTWTRREGMISDREILGARILDRTVRPLFPKGFARECQVVASLLAADEDGPPEVASVAAAAAALMVSDVPWRGPAGAVTVGWLNGNAVLNPTADELAESTLQLLYSGTRDRCLMLEVGAKEMPEEHLIEALRVAHAGLEPILDLQEEIAAFGGRGVRPLDTDTEQLTRDLRAAAETEIGVAARNLFAVPQSKSARGIRQGMLQSQCVERLKLLFPDVDSWRLESAAGAVTGAAVRDNILRAASKPLDPTSRGVTLRRPEPRGQSVMRADAGVDSPSKGKGLAALVSAASPSPNAEEDGSDEGSAVADSAVGVGILTPERLGFKHAVSADGDELVVDPYGPAEAAGWIPCGMDSGWRVDGRAADEVRPLQCEPGVLPVVHGSSVFARGGTQVMCTTTLGPPEIAQMLRPVGGGPTQKTFMLHYDFPPYSTNNTGRVGGINRRMIGHGNLAEKAIAAVMPDEDDFRFTVRVTAEVTGSDGSSSMATATGATLALLDAGVPIRRPVAGVSIGMVTEPSASSGEPGRFVLLSDIVGMEDHAGDMDFKVAGSRQGVTAAQLDIKLDGGVPPVLLESALWRAAAGRNHILDAVEASAPRDRKGLRESAPRIELLPVAFTKRGMLIGPGGATIRRIQRESGAAVRLMPDADFVQVFARSEEALIVARQLIGEALAGADDRERSGSAEEGGGMVRSFGREIAPAIRVGEQVEVRVQQVLEFGAVCVVEGRFGGSGDGGTVEGLLHVSEMVSEHSQRGTRHAGDVVEEGARLQVMVLDVDPKMRGKFSMRGVQQQQEVALAASSEQEVALAASGDEQEVALAASGDEQGVALAASSEQDDETTAANSDDESAASIEGSDSEGGIEITPPDIEDGSDTAESEEGLQSSPARMAMAERISQQGAAVRQRLLQSGDWDVETSLDYAEAVKLAMESDATLPRR
jgi:polyribonucleotide nucleotidyltransferase